MELALFHRWTREKIQVMVIDHAAHTHYQVGSSVAWNWQQGSMAQWLPKKDAPLLAFNTIRDGILGCELIGLEEDAGRFIPWPIQALHPDGHEMLSLNYRRLSQLRPDYGYSVEVANFSLNQDLERDGIWKVNLEAGTGKLLLSLAELAERNPVPEMNGAGHKVNHLIFSPSGKKYVFLHRFIGANGKFSRLYVADTEGSGLRLLLDTRMVSHYHWKDDNHLLVWGRTKEMGDHYYLIDVRTGGWYVIGEDILDKFGDGHCTFSPDGRWIVTDTYPDRARLQRLILYNLETNKYVIAGRFFSPPPFTNVYRCDLHPRWSPDGRWISIDSAHEGVRKTYFLDVSGLVEDR